MEKNIIRQKCEKADKADKSGYIITYAHGNITTSDKCEALKIYKSISGHKTLSVCDGGYIIPLLEE